MWPFDLRGPEFLPVYLAFGAIVLVAAYLRRLASEPIRRDLRLSDPYQIAFLRGGATEAIRVAVVGLVDRRLLAADGAQLLSGGSPPPGLLPLERAILIHFAQVKPAYSAVSDRTVRAAADRIQPDLERLGLLPDQGIQRSRLATALPALAVLWLVAGLKVMIAVTGGHRNFGFLILLAIGFSIALIFSVFRSRTRAGDVALQDLRTLLFGLPARAAAVGAGEVALAAAVFGMTALPSARHPQIRALFPRASAGDSGSCGSSSDSGSSSSSCSSSCGGGGGGCGGCGG